MQEVIIKIIITIFFIYFPADFVGNLLRRLFILKVDFSFVQQTFDEVPPSFSSAAVHL